MTKMNIPAVENATNIICRKFKNDAPAKISCERQRSKIFLCQNIKHN